MNYNDLAWGWGGGVGAGAGGDFHGDDYKAGWGSYSDPAWYGSNIKVQPTPQNVALLRSLGFQGDPMQQFASGDIADGTSSSYDGWSPAALQWMDANGIQQGVAHLPDTSVSFGSGRPELYGLLGKDGKLLQGQSDPVVTQSDSLMDQITPFLMLAGPLASAMGTAGAGTGAGAGSALADTGSEALSSAGSLGAAGSDVASLGSAWSPQGLGLTSLPAQTAIDYGSLTVPSLTPSIGDMALKGALRGGAMGGIKGVATGQDPLTSALQGAAGGALAGGIAGGVGNFNPGGSPIVNGALSGGITAGVAGGNPLMGAIGGGIGGAAGSQFGGGSAPPSASTSVPLGGNMDFNFDPSSLGNIFGLGSDPNAFDPSAMGSPGSFTTAPTGAYSWGNLDPSFANYLVNSTFPTDSGSSSGGSGLPSWLADAAKGVVGAAGGGGNLAALIGAALGASQGGKTLQQINQSKMDPRMEQYVYGSGYGDPNSVLGAAMKQFQANPTGINPTMQQGLDMQKALLADPSFAQPYQQMRSLGLGLMGGGVAANPFSQAGAAMPGAQLPQPMNPQLPLPMVQAGGSGGLLGNDAAARMRALNTMGRGLTG